VVKADHSNIASVSEHNHKNGEKAKSKIQSEDPKVRFAPPHFLIFDGSEVKSKTTALTSDFPERRSRFWRSHPTQHQPTTNHELAQSKREHFMRRPELSVLLVIHACSFTKSGIEGLSNSLSL